MLKSFSLAPKNDIPDKVWLLFEGAGELGDRFDYSIEIIDNAMSGRINFSMDFNLRAYINKIAEVKRKEGCKEAKRFISITDNTDDWDDYGDMPVDRLSAYAGMRNPYEEFEQEEDLKFCVSEIHRLSSDILVYDRIAICHCVRQALKGMPDSVRMLKRLVEDDPYVGDLLYVILSSGYSFDELFEDKQGRRCC